MEFEIDDDISDFDIRLPTKKLNINDDTVLFNKANISNDIISMSSKQNSECESVADIKELSSSDEYASSEDEDAAYGNRQNKQHQNPFTFQQQQYQQRQPPPQQQYNQNYGGGNHDSTMDKREILYQFDRLKSKGVKVPYDFTMNSDLNEMRNAYDRIKHEREIDASVRFQRKMMMGFVTGFEFLNTRYDPFSIELDGWSEQIHENIDDYDDIFEELHDKYKETGQDMAPELRLMVSLGGSAFMFHLTKRMFSNTKIPKVEEVLKKNPNLMRQFQEASAMEYMNGMRPDSAPTRPAATRPAEPQTDLFGMVSSLFNTSGGGNVNNNQNMDVDDIINNVHSQININPNMDDNMMETLTVTDEEITSLIEDTAGIIGGSGGNTKRKSGKKTNKPKDDKRVLSL